MRRREAQPSVAGRQQAECMRRSGIGAMCAGGSPTTPACLVQVRELDVVALNQVHIVQLQPRQRLADAGGHALGAAH